jgi:hypothetical protein
MVEGVTGGVFFLYKDHQSRGEERREGTTDLDDLLWVERLGWLLTNRWDLFLLLRDGRVGK